MVEATMKAPVRRVVKRQVSLLENPYTWVVTPLVTLFGIYNIMFPFSVYHWFENFVNRVFVNNEAINVDNLTSLFSSNVQGSMIVSGVLLVALLFAGWLTKKRVTEKRYMDLWQPALALVIGAFGSTVAGIVTKVLPITPFQGLEMFIILAVFLALAGILLMLMSVSYSNYTMEKGYIMIPIIILVFQGLYLFCCGMWPAYLPDFSVKNVVISSQLVWTLIFFLGYFWVVRATRKSSGRAVGMMTVTEDETHPEHEEDCN